MKSELAELLKIESGEVSDVILEGEEGEDIYQLRAEEVRRVLAGGSIEYLPKWGHAYLRDKYLEPGQAMTAPDSPPEKRKAPPAANWQGRLSLIGLQALYLFGQLLQYPLEASFWILTGWLAGLDEEILRRKGGA